MQDEVEREKGKGKVLLEEQKAKLMTMKQQQWFEISEKNQVVLVLRDWRQRNHVEDFEYLELAEKQVEQQEWEFVSSFPEPSGLLQQVEQKGWVEVEHECPNFGKTIDLVLKFPKQLVSVVAIVEHSSFV